MRGMELKWLAEGRGVAGLLVALGYRIQASGLVRGFGDIWGSRSGIRIKA